MAFIVIGVSAFIFLFLYDVYTIKNYGIKRLHGIIGIILLLYSSIMIAIVSEKINIPFNIRLASWILFLISLMLLIYSLFIELPFSKTYGEKQHSSILITTGTYALCRHPGVLWFGFVFLFFFMATGSVLLIPAGIIWTGLDILHVYLQEKIFFPKMFQGYDAYMKTTPMLMPSKKSVIKCISTLF